MQKKSFLLTPIIILIGLVVVSARAEINYRPFNLSPEHITSLLGRTIRVPVDANTFPADISFLCADVKFDGTTLKFCELGDAVYMFFTRDMDLEIDGQIVQMHAPGWGVFWHYLKQFRLPIWFVGKVSNYNAMAFDEFKRLGGRYSPDVQALKNDHIFRRLRKSSFKKTGCVKDYSGIIVCCLYDEHERDGQELKSFKQQHPEFIVVNSVARNVVANKSHTYQLFQDAGLDHVIPKTKIVPKKYSQELLLSGFVDEIASPYLVIKPLTGSCSRGVTVIEKDLLEVTLALLDKNPLFEELRHDTGKELMISEYAPSKVLIKEGKRYDPTMRVMVVIRHDAGKVFVTVIGAFWKIPVTSLDDEATLTEKHVTRAHLVLKDPDAFHSGILVEKDDMTSARSILNTCLPRLYQAMLEKYVSTEKIPAEKPGSQNSSLRLQIFNQNIL